jgi:hypothetical protein
MIKLHNNAKSNFFFARYKIYDYDKKFVTRIQFDFAVHLFSNFVKLNVQDIS